jgi:hypothetical protein
MWVVIEDERTLVVDDSAVLENEGVDPASRGQHQRLRVSAFQRAITAAMRSPRWHAIGLSVRVTRGAAFSLAVPGMQD